MVIETYIFSLDDTIIDMAVFSRMHSELLNTLMKELKINEIELQKIITKLKEETAREKIDSFTLSKKLNSTETYYKVLEKYAKHTYSLKTKSIPKVFRKIKDNKKKIGVVSNCPKRTIELFLNRFNLLDYIDFISSGILDTVLFWVTLIKKHDLDKNYTLFIDNSENILKIAEHAGYRVLNVKNIDSLTSFENF